MTEQVDKTNAVVRLRHIVEAAAEVPNVDGSAQLTFRQAWSRVFGITDPNEDGFLELISRILELRKLFDEVIDSLRELGLDEEMFIQPVHLMGSTLSNLRIFDKPWANYNGQFNPAHLTALKFIEREFSKYEQYSEASAKEQEIVEILKTIDQATEQILDSKLSRASKQLLLDILERLRSGLLNYRIRGAKALREALGDVLGKVAVNQPAIEALEKTPEGVTVRGVFLTVTKVYNFVEKNVPLLEAGVNFVKGFLGSGG